MRARLRDREAARGTGFREDAARLAARNAPEYRTLYAASANRAPSWRTRSSASRGPGRRSTRRGQNSYPGAIPFAPGFSCGDSTYQGYDSIVRGITRARALTAVTDTTAATAGRTSSWRAARGGSMPGRGTRTDPNAEWYWNVRVTGDTVMLPSTPAPAGPSTEVHGRNRCSASRRRRGGAPLSHRPRSPRRRAGPSLRPGGDGQDLLAERSKGRPARRSWCTRCPTSSAPIAASTAWTSSRARAQLHRHRQGSVGLQSNFPLTSVHANAAADAELALCGSPPGEVLAAARPDLQVPGNLGAAPRAGPVSALPGRLGRGARGSRSSVSDPRGGPGRAQGRCGRGAAIRRQSTPTFYIDGGLLVGAQPMRYGSRYLDSIYQAKKA